MELRALCENIKKSIVPQKTVKTFIYPQNILIIKSLIHISLLISPAVVLLYILSIILLQEENVHTQKMI